MRRRVFPFAVCFAAPSESGGSTNNPDSASAPVDQGTHDKVNTGQDAVQEFGGDAHEPNPQSANDAPVGDGAHSAEDLDAKREAGAQGGGDADNPNPQSANDAPVGDGAHSAEDLDVKGDGAVQESGDDAHEPNSASAPVDQGTRAKGNTGQDAGAQGGDAG